MMKKILIVLVALLWGRAEAQVSLTKDDLPQAGIKVMMVTDSFPESTLTITPASPNSQTWDYTNAFPTVNDTMDNFMVPAQGTPYDTLFDKANLAAIDIVGGSYAYFISRDDGFYFDGVYTQACGQPFILDFEPDQILMPVPFSFNQIRFDTTHFDLNFNTPQGKMKISITDHMKTTADAWGSLTTPVGTYPSILRLRTDHLFHTDVYAFYNNQYNLVHQSDSSGTSYNWYRKGNKAHVMSIELDINGDPARASYQYDPVSGWKEKSAAGGVEVFPNPVRDGQFAVKTEGFSGMVSAKLFSLDGRLVWQEAVTATSGLGWLRMNAGDLPAGLYLLQLSNGPNTTLVRVLLE